MKKLLRILAGLVIMGAPASSVIACGTTNTDHTNSDGNSDFAKWLPGLYDGKNPDSVDVWNEMTPFEGSGPNATNPSFWDGTERSNAAIQILRILDVAILAQIGSGNINLADIKGSETTNVTPYLSSLNDALQQDWTNLKQAVKNEVEAKKQSYKDQYGKKWEDKYNEMLKDDYNNSEQEYEAYLYASGTDNATTELTNTLLNNDQTSFNNVSASSAFQEYSNQYLKSGETWATWSAKSDNAETAREIVLSITPYIKADSSDVSDVWKADNDGTLTSADITSNDPTDKLILSDFKNSVPIATYDTTKKTFTKEFTKYPNSAYTNGINSPYQDWLYNYWYQKEHPLAVSDLAFDLSSPPSGTTGLYTKLNNVNLFKQQTKAQLSAVLTALQTKSWSELSEAVPQVKVTHESSLLTLNPDSGSTFNTNYVASVYGALPALTNSSKMSYKPVTTIPQEWLASGGTPAKTAFIKSDGTGSIDRSSSLTLPQPAKTPQTMFGVYDIGPKLQVPSGSTAPDHDRVVVFLDDKALHIVHVDGLSDYLLSTPKAPGYDTPTALAQDLNNMRLNLDDKITQSDFNKPINPGNFMGRLSKDNNFQAFNQGIQNNYLQFLVDQSYVSSVNSDQKGLYAFDTSQALKSYASFDSSTATGNHLWFQWIYDFFNKNLKADWLDSFVKINLPSGDANADVYNWFTQSLNNFDTSLISYPQESFVTNINKANTTIDEGGPNPGLGEEYPDGTYWFNQSSSFLQDILKNIEIWGS